MRLCIRPNIWEESLINKKKYFLFLISKIYESLNIFIYSYTTNSILTKSHLIRRDTHIPSFFLENIWIYKNTFFSLCDYIVHFFYLVHHELIYHHHQTHQRYLLHYPTPISPYTVKSLKFLIHSKLLNQLHLDPSSRSTYRQTASIGSIYLKYQNRSVQQSPKGSIRQWFWVMIQVWVQMQALHQMSGIGSRISIHNYLLTVRSVLLSQVYLGQQIIKLYLKFSLSLRLELPRSTRIW